ncbi:MAG: rhomboid family intramembrane serine protease [Niabella sp.]
MVEYPITYLLIAVNVVVSMMGFSNPALIDKTIFWPYRMGRENQYYRFITSGFIHADFMHLFFNMFTLYFFGRLIEVYFAMYGLGGKVAYLLLYFIGLVVASIPSYIKHQNDYAYRGLGASGAVSAVVFACVLFQPWGTLYLYFIPMPAIVFAILYLWYCVYMSKRAADNINHDAHLWGSLWGLAFTLALIAAMQPGLFPGIFYELTHPHFNL